MHQTSALTTAQLIWLHPSYSDKRDTARGRARTPVLACAGLCQQCWLCRVCPVQSGVSSAHSICAHHFHQLGCAGGPVQ